MRRFGILGASYVGPAGHGNHQTGLRPWPASLEPEFRAGRLAELHWSLLFKSDPGRFGRMDLMSRLGLIAVELLGAEFDTFTQEARDRVGVFVESSVGCLGTDLRFLQTPRASLFTYTLPSTVIGEICIRYRLRGPLTCLVHDSPGESPAFAEAARQFEDGEVDRCLCVSCEALDWETVHNLGAPSFAPAPHWEACALLLGTCESGHAEPCEHLVSMPEICRRLCSVTPFRSGRARWGKGPAKRWSQSPTGTSDST